MTEFNSDEVRRELRSIDQDQRAVDRSWRSALTRLFDPDSGFSTDEKAGILGVPSRRQMLRFGGLTVAGAALLAACGDDGGSSSTATTRAAGATTGAPGTTAASASMDLTLAKTAASLEALAVATYDTAIKSGLVKTAAIGDAAKLFQAHHQAHLDALNAVVVQSGSAKITVPNDAVKKAIVDPAVAAAKTEADIVNLAFTLEDAAAQTYVFAATQLSKPALRSTIMTIGGIEARHRAILAVVAQGKKPADVFPSGFFKADNPLPAAALIS
ncbi:MAG: ferritin-like domain-containing protein [Acidimicrobiales bacterium]